MQEHTFTLLTPCSHSIIQPFNLSESGKLTLTSSLDAYQYNRYQLLVQLCDISFFHSNRRRFPSLHSGVPMLCTEENITIVVSTVDKAPICYPDLFHLQEHIPIGSAISTYQVISRPHEQIVYTMPNNSFITIHPLTGVLQTVRDIDYETTLNQQ